MQMVACTLLPYCCQLGGPLASEASQCTDLVVVCLGGCAPKGFIHMSVFGKDIDVGGFVAGEETSADATGGDG